MNRRDGEYYYARHGTCWGIWRWHAWTANVDDCGFGSFVKDCMTRQEASDEVYRLNGWSR